MAQNIEKSKGFINDLGSNLKALQEENNNLESLNAIAEIESIASLKDIEY